MSYRSVVLTDSPIGFWPLDDITTYSMMDFADILATFTDYQDLKDNYLAYANITNAIAIDYSGCGNNGQYVGVPETGILPLVYNGVYSYLIDTDSFITLPVNNTFYQSGTYSGFGTNDTYKNKFSLEIWVLPKITTTNKVLLIGDESSNIGIYYHRGSIVFNLQDQEISSFLNIGEKATHIVGVYSETSMSLYLDGVLVASKDLTDLIFTNNELEISVGPTQSSNDKFFADCPAVYRSDLSETSIKNHYDAGIRNINQILMTRSDGGYLFSTTDQQLNSIYNYTYGSYDYQRFLTEDTYYDIDRGYVTFYKSTGAKTAVFYNIIPVPTTLNIVSSKIEWRTDVKILESGIFTDGIMVEVSYDGTNWVEVENESYLPNFNKNNTVVISEIYLRITLKTSDSSKYLPKFSKMKLSFFDTKDLYADNYGYKITSTADYALTSKNNPPLSRNKYDGIKTTATAGFKTTVEDTIGSVEFLYTPSALTQSTLINNSTANYSWSSGGVISKTNISKIYVNGVDKTSQTSISNVFNADRMHHVIIVFSTEIVGDIKFNYNTSGGPSNKFNNISIYPKKLSVAEIIQHYSALIGYSYNQVSDSAIKVTDQGSIYSNVDWTVVSTV